MGINLPVRCAILIKTRKLIPIIVFLFLAGAAFVFTKCFMSYGHLNIRVVDAYTLAPIEGAAVTVADVNKTLYSDSSGSCIFTGIPIRVNSLHQRLIPQAWGECTVISVFDGYRPTVILDTHVEKDRMRNGPTVYMFPKELDDIEVAAIVESPDNEWIAQLVEKYSE